jgi:D-alanine-D-alanine ligase
MTKLSLVPEIAAYSGMSFIDLIEWIIKDASISR